ncbi:Y-family DNA polymerase [Nioella nitratireducens]|uniref:Y-family DNA polymerase n=1 Tax=Nioella nitratireducens TaxID=1287720 RepID=UPI0008FD3333|nr:DNA polymerase Y family protein [Nioella nitratireducens]
MTAFRAPSPDPQRRILSLWFSRLAAEHVLRLDRGMGDRPLVIVEEVGAARVLRSVSQAAAEQGARVGQPLAEARALCPDLLTRPADPLRERAFLARLARWAGKVSPLVAPEGVAGLLIDITGVAHLFGGEDGLVAQVEGDCAGLGLTVQVGLADTAGAAWALARHAGQGGMAARSGDAIDQEARATRSRAGKRHWTKGGAAPPQATPAAAHRIAAPGQTRQAIGDLPVAALRLEADTLAALSRLGLSRIRDLFGPPRATLARRFGRGLVRRLDQALGLEPEPITPLAPDTRFAVRFSLPDPIGLEEDILAGIDRMLPVLCSKLAAKGQGARRLRLHLSLAEGRTESVELGLARATADPHRIRPLLAMKLKDVDPGFGIDILRLEAHVTEAVHARQVKGGMDAATEASMRQGRDTALEDLMARIGTRVGLEAITRQHPADSHIPEKTAHRVAAAWSGPAPDWPGQPRPRPLTLFRPEPVQARDGADLPDRFRWRGRNFTTQSGLGPERIAPEWWLDDPEWRSGVRDYWRVETAGGERLWLFYAHGGSLSGGWFCHGDFG